MKLTLKQKRFVEQYVETGNATEAAARVYDVMNRNTAKCIGSENLTKPAIKNAIRERMLDSGEMEVDIMSRIGRLAREGRSESVRLKATIELAKILGLYEKNRQKMSESIRL